MDMLSVIIPARNAYKTLRYTLQTVLNLSMNVEIIVVDNASTDETANFLSTIADARLTVIHQQTSVSMANNWQTGINAAQGDFVTVIGADDLLWPASLRRALALYADLDKANTAIYCHRRHFYWGDYQKPQDANTFAIGVGQHVASLSPATLLDLCFRGILSYQHLPGFYNAVISRELLEKYRFRLNGCLFPSYVVSPDMFSACLFCTILDTAVYTDSSFSVSGLSALSNGAGLALEVRDQFLNGLTLDDRDRAFLDAGIECFGYAATPGQLVPRGLFDFMKELDIYWQRLSRQCDAERSCLPPKRPMAYALGQMLARGLLQRQHGCVADYHLSPVESGSIIADQLSMFHIVFALPPPKVLCGRFNGTSATSLDMQEWLARTSKGG